MFLYSVVFIASDNCSKKLFLSNFSKSDYGNPIDQFGFDGRLYSRSDPNYFVGQNCVKQHVEDTELIKMVLEIGGGFGAFGEIVSYTPQD